MTDTLFRDFKLDHCTRFTLKINRKKRFKLMSLTADIEMMEKERRELAFSPCRV